ncbi:laccase, multicopper oxidase, benzenediol:oxygen oxidorectuctase [Mortierella alpina]|nr:laccase, multicopper oxidase, benzenediol:oxygen oxidorectuctase [Mortierella alpina]
MLSSQFGLRTFIVFIVHVNAVLGRIGPFANIPVFSSEFSPDGFSRPMLLAGGTFPGPLVTGIKGNTFKINVINRATDAQAIAVQWHGISHQSHTFEYGFAADQAGDFSYRPLIVYDPEDPHSSLYDVDDESTVVTLTDHYHADAGALMNSYLKGATKGNIPTPAGGLINGKGRYLNGPASELPVINVQPSKRYRFRVINIGTATPFQFSIDEHKLTVIAVDGTPVRPYTVDRLRIDVGQRYSVVLIANQAIRNYWTRAVMDTTCFADASTVDPVVKAVLRYEGAPNADPTTTPKAQYDDLKQHGYKFHVVSEDGKTYNYVDSVIRDTVTVAANGKAVLRFTASHAGVWAFHAQNEWYRQAGLLAVLMSMPEEIANTSNVL